MSRTQVEIKTDDGVCPTSVFIPDGNGPWPGVIFYMDGPGIRPLLFYCELRKYMTSDTQA